MMKPRTLTLLSLGLALAFGMVFWIQKNGDIKPIISQMPPPKPAEPGSIPIPKTENSEAPNPETAAQKPPQAFAGKLVFARLYSQHLSIDAELMTGQASFNQALCPDGKLHPIEYLQSRLEPAEATESSDEFSLRKGDHYRIKDVTEKLSGVCLLFAPTAQIDILTDNQSATRDCTEAEQKQLPQTGNAPADIRLCRSTTINTEVQWRVAMTRADKICSISQFLQFKGRIFDLSENYQGTFGRGDEPNADAKELCRFAGGEFDFSEEDFKSGRMQLPSIESSFQFDNEQFALLEAMGTEGAMYKLVQVKADSAQAVLSYYDYHFGGWTW